jgi:cation/acetate symporter
VLRQGAADSAKELRVSRWTVVALASIAVFLGILFEKQNVAFLVSLAFALAASANFPVLLLSIFWSSCTTKGVVAGGFAGLVLAIVLTTFSPAVWEGILGLTDAPFAFTSPTIVSLPIAFVTIWLVSVFDRGGRAAVDRAGFRTQQVRSETGIGAERPIAH